jgi:hypothetical protein
MTATGEQGNLQTQAKGGDAVSATERLNVPPPEPESEDEDYPESWLPWKVADQPRTLVGTVADYSKGPDFGYGPCWICTVTDRCGKPWSVWLSQEVLRRQFEEERPMPGEQLSLRYMGMQDKPKRGGPGYHRFRLTVQRGPRLPEFLLEPGRDAETDSPADATVDVVPDADVVEGDSDADLFGDDPPY